MILKLRKFFNLFKLYNLTKTSLVEQGLKHVSVVQILVDCLFNLNKFTACKKLKNIHIIETKCLNKINK